MKLKIYHVILIAVAILLLGLGTYWGYVHSLKKAKIGQNLDKEVLKSKIVEDKSKLENSNRVEKIDKNKVINETKEETIDTLNDRVKEPYVDEMMEEGTPVKNGETIKPSKKIDKVFMTEDEIEGYGYTISIDDEIDETEKFYNSQLCIGDAVWSGIVTDYKASSTYKTSNDKYNVNNLSNLALDNCWCEGSDGNGIGTTIDISLFDSCEKVEWYNYEDDNKDKKKYDSLDDVIDYLKEYHNSQSRTSVYEEVEVTEETLKNHYRNEVYQIALINGYAKDNELWKNNNRVKKLLLTIDDKIEVTLDVEDTKDIQLFDIYYGNDTITKKIDLKFKILEVYPGEKYDDTCLTSLYVVGGSNVHWGGR